MFLTALVLDSPFSDITEMIKDVAYENLGLPGILVNLALQFLSIQIKSRVHFNILDIRPAEFAK